MRNSEFDYSYRGDGNSFQVQQESLVEFEGPNTRSNRGHLGLLTDLSPKDLRETVSENRCGQILN